MTSLPHFICLLIFGLVFRLDAFATTVVPPEFDSLVQQADYVVRGTVSSTTSEWRMQNGHRNIVTFVNVNVVETIAGTAPAPLTLQILGGKIGDKEMIVQGSPAFTIGEEYILFIRGNGVQFNPLVALMHGQYPVKKDSAGRAFVTRSDGSPLLDEKDVSLPMDSHAETTTDHPRTAASQPVASSALSTEEFASRIRTSRQKTAASTHAK